MSGELAGLSGVITGAASGIGAALAEAFAEAGATLDLWDVEAGERIAAIVDVSDPAAVGEATAGAVRRLGRVDFLVNNAGVRAQGPFLECEFDDWQRVIDVDLSGVWNCSQAVGRHMAQQGRGKVLNIASIVATHALRNRPAYVAAKAGVAGLTRAMAFELGPRGIRCNAIGPGVIETPLTRSYFEDPELAQLIRDETPLGYWGTPSDLAGPAIFLCSPAADYVSGQLLFVDGGWTAGKGY
ncbi:MAG: SDR family oxidoreductase [Solirubrobacterales bacterium]|nr:SDR family oxidoreductase [Solirubrobacterales bacterium]